MVATDDRFSKEYRISFFSFSGFPNRGRDAAKESLVAIRNLRGAPLVVTTDDRFSN